MNIKTKYAVSQSVFAMIKNKIAEVYIKKAVIEIVDGYGSAPPVMSLTYYASEKYRFFRQKALPYKESELYATKEELLQTI